MMRRLSAFFVALSFAWLGLAADKAPTEVVMGFNPAENTEVVQANSKDLSEYFKKKLGMTVKTFIATDYTALIEALRSGTIDFAWLPPFSLVKAEEIAGAKVLLKAVRRGKAQYYSAIITRQDKPVKNYKDLKGKNMAWVDPSSVSGHIYPKADLMSKLKLKTPEELDAFLGKQTFAGSHDALVLAVLNGTVDAGATFCNGTKGEEGAWLQYLKKPEDQAKIHVVYVTDPIPGDTMATSKKFLAAHPAEVKKVTSLLEEMGKDAEGKKILMALYHIESMIPAASKDFEPVRKAAKKIKIEK